MVQDRVVIVWMQSRERSGGGEGMPGAVQCPKNV